MMMKALLVLLVLVQQDIPDHPDKLQYPPLKFEVPDPASMRSVLGAGPVVYALEDPTLPLVHVQVYVRGPGSFANPKGKEGLSGLCAAVLRTGGTAKLEPQTLEEELDFLAADLGVSSAEVLSAASLSVLSKDLDRGLEILFDVLRNPEFRQEKLDLAKAQTLDGLKARNDSAAAIEAREAALLFYGQAFPINRLATRASVESITRADLQGFHRTWFQPVNFVIAAAGNFKRAELLKKFEAALDGWKSQKIPDKLELGAPVLAAAGAYGFSKDIPQGRVTVGHLGIDIHHPDLHAIRIMNYILGGGGFSSRLMQRVRTDEGLVYDVDSAFQPKFQYPGIFRIAFQSKSESCAFALQLCIREVDRMRTLKPSTEEVEAVKRFFLDGFPGFFFGTKFDTVKTFAAAELNGYPKNYYQQYREKIAAVSPDDVLRVAKEHLHPEKFVIVCVGNLGVMAKGDGKHPVTFQEFGGLKLVPLPNPETLERTK